MFRLPDLKGFTLFTGTIATALTAALYLSTTAAGASPIQRSSVVRPAPAPPTTTLYVADQANNAIWYFHAGVNPACVSPGQKPAVIAPSNEMTGPWFSNPEGIALDSNGDLYVANYIGNNVGVFAGSSILGGPPAPPLTSYSAGLNGPTDVLVNAGAVYVSNAGPATPFSPYSDIVVYGPNSTTPALTWTSPIAGAQLLGMMLTNSGVYASYDNLATNTDGFLRCTAGSATCSDLGTTGANAFPIGQTHDSSYTHVFTASATSVQEYNYPAGTLCATFTPIAGNYVGNPTHEPIVTPSLTGIAVTSASY